MKLFFKFIIFIALYFISSQLTKAQSIHPDFERAMELSMQGKYEEAMNIIKPLKKSLDTNEQNYLICLIFLSELSTKSYKPHDAIKYNEEILKRMPEGEVDALAIIARNKTLLGDFPGAITAYERILKLNPDYSIAFGNLANVYNYSGQYKKAIEILDKPGVDSSNNYLLHARALSYFRLNQYDSAKKYIDAFLLKNEADTDYMAYLDASEIYNAFGNKKKSCEYILKANEILHNENIEEQMAKNKEVLKTFWTYKNAENQITRIKLLKIKNCK